MAIPTLAAGAAWGQGEYDAVQRGKEVYESLGGSVDKLQQIVWDGTTVAADIQSAVAAKDGFLLRFTKPLSANVTNEARSATVKIKSFQITHQMHKG